MRSSSVCQMTAQSSKLCRRDNSRESCESGYFGGLAQSLARTNSSLVTRHRRTVWVNRWCYSSLRAVACETRHLAAGSCKSSATAVNSVYVFKLPSHSCIMANVSGFTEAGAGFLARFSGCSDTTAGVNGRECLLQIRIFLGTPSFGTTGSGLLVMIRVLRVASASDASVPAAISVSPTG